MRTVLRFPLSLVLLSLLVVPAGDIAAQRHRIVAPRPAETPREWLARNAHPLATTELQPQYDDLEPVRSVVGGAGVVGLGDGTHGTREFYTVKLRLIDFLAREMDFDLVAFEAPLPLFDKLNAYVQGAPGDPAGLLNDGHRRLGYSFWDVQEMVDVIEALRLYNATRGEKPAIAIAGMDVYDARAASDVVVAYLQQADPAAANDARAKYACVTETMAFGTCRDDAEAVRSALAARRDELSAATGPNAFEEALQHATIVWQSGMFHERDELMAANTRWLREHRSRSGRIAVWAHQEHVGHAPSVWTTTRDTMGMYLERDLGAEYVVIGTLTGSGTFLQWTRPSGTLLGEGVVSQVPALGAGYLESTLRLGPSTRFLLSLRNAPPWLTATTTHFTAGTKHIEDETARGSLPDKLDAVIYIESTTANSPLRH